MSHQDIVVEFVYYSIQATLLMGVFAISFLLIYGVIQLVAWLRSRRTKH